MENQAFKMYRIKTIEAIKRNKATAEHVRSLFNDTSNDKDASKQWIKHRESLKTDEEFLKFFKEHFGQEL